MGNPIDCIIKHAPHLSTDKNISRQEATDLVLKEYEKLHGELENFKKTINPKYQKKAYEAPKIDEEKIKSINDAYEKNIQELTKPVEPIEAEEKQQPEKPTDKKSEGTAEPPNPPLVEEKGEGGGKEPPIPPKESVAEKEDAKNGKNKGILAHLHKAKNIPEAARKGFEEEGLKYTTKSQKEAESVAKSIIDFAGLDEAVLMAEAQKFDGDVNSLIFGEALNKIANQELLAKTPEEKLAAAKKFAEVGITYDKMARYGGRFNAAINYFYKKSPLGVVMMENARRKDDFNQWSKPKDKSWKEFYDELKKVPEFDAIVKEEIQAASKKENKEKRVSKRKAISDAFDKAKIKGGAKSVIIPPVLWNGAVEIMKQAYLAGETLVDTIQKGVDYIKKNHKEDWDEDAFWVEWTGRLMEMEGDQPQSGFSKLKQKILNQVADLNEQIKNKKRKPKSEKIDLTPEQQKEIDELINKRDKLKEKLEKVAPISEANWYKNRLSYIEKFREKLKGLTEKQKDEVIKKSLNELVNKEALEYEDLRKIIAQATGRADLTAEEAAKMKELVQKTNAVDDAAQKWRTEKTKEAEVGYRKAQIEATKATRDLNDMFQDKPDIIRRLVSMMQLNTLGVVSLVANVAYNVWNQSFIRFPIGVINNLFDRGISLFDKNYVREFATIEAQKDFWQSLGVGSKEAVQQIGTGLSRQDYLSKEVPSQFRPFKSVRDLWAWKNNKKNLTKAQFWDKVLQAMPQGMSAEIVARLLNVGDKPQRFGAEGAQAATFAKALGLKDIDKQLFIEFPREQAYEAYKAQGYSDEVAGQKADYIKEAIIKEGKRSTFQQDNLLNDAITRAAGVLGGKDSGTAGLAKSLVISPYIKIPTNAFWSMYNMVNPEVAILQAITHAGIAKKFKNKGELTKASLQNREARYWMAHAIWGIGMRAIVISLVKAGIFVPSADDDESKKERDANSFFDKPGYINVGNLKISNRWFGVLGSMGNVIAKKWKDMTPEQREAQDDFWNTVLGGVELDALKEMENGVFANSSSLLQSLGTGDWSRYGMNAINLFSNIIQPATSAQFDRAQLDYVPTSKGDSFLDKLNQNFAQRSKLYRKIFDVQINQKKDVWGKPIPKGGNELSRMFGISKANPQIATRPMYDDYLRTGDSGFLPPAVLPILNGQKLNSEQENKLIEYVGSEREKLAQPFIDDKAVINGWNATYSELKNPDGTSNDEIKKFVLSRFYDIGRINGLELFYQDYPEFRPKNEPVNYSEEVKKDIFNSLLSIQKYRK